MSSRPALKKIINAHVGQFLHKEDYRTKANVPDLGEFLILLACSDYHWTEAAPIILREIFERNVKWVLKAVPFLKTIESTPQGFDQFRLDKTFEACKTSFRILMFQGTLFFSFEIIIRGALSLITVFFMEQFASPSGKSSADLLQRYNLTFSRPNEGMKQALVANSFEILKVDTWPYFSPIRYPLPFALSLIWDLANSSRAC